MEKHCCVGKVDWGLQGSSLANFGVYVFLFLSFCHCVMPIHGLIHDGQLRACPSCLLGLRF
jgi:hypothetical protein